MTKYDFYIDRCLDLEPANWSHALIDNGDPNWVLELWKAK